jgi:hypothetical protein
MKMFRYTPESLFDHLFRELDKEVDGERMLTHLQSLDEEGWRQQPNGAIVEITGTLKVPDVMKVIGAMRGLGNLMPLIESLRETGQIEMNQEDRVMMNGLRMLSELGESTESQNATAVGLEVAATPDYRFGASLKKTFLRTGPQDLEGEAKVLGKVQRKVNKGDAPIELEQLVPGFEAFRGDSKTSAQKHNLRTKPSLLASRQLHTFP